MLRDDGCLYRDEVELVHLPSSIGVGRVVASDLTDDIVFEAVP
jgi:hypothetical protein